MWFGKTEVAIRAAFKAMEFGKQVAVLVPTTVLSEQHERTFRGRMADYPFRVVSLSRFRTGSEQTQIVAGLSQGSIDLVIGTHRLLSDDIVFHDLGLVIIDEEQRFGVEHKQKLLQLRLTADVLTLSATPIPRTLHMALLGLRDISSLSTPPADRRAIVTEVMPYDRQRVQQAIVRELNRDGQIYFVHNRIHSLQTLADELHQLAPQARIVIGHGQMSGHELEEVMLKFMRREADILVSTTIIESGIDIPTANTMFIHDADHYGLAELHQLRGRVGRWKHRAYCYLLLPHDRPVTDKAAKRLKAIEQYAMLGAGFKIAMRDLEIRGAGNILGKQQSGHIAAVGYEMYCRLLEDQARQLRQETIIEPSRTTLELPIAGRIPKQYIPSDKHRMEMYRRFSRAVTMQELDALAADMTDAYGQAPEAVQKLVDLTELRIAAGTLEISVIKLEPPDVIFTTRHPPRLDQLLKKCTGQSDAGGCQNGVLPPAGELFGAGVHAAGRAAQNAGPPHARRSVINHYHLYKMSLFTPDAHAEAGRRQQRYHAPDWRECVH
ncbi:MAG: DEAD/DEAH box helicase [Phycisphaerales bacterium]|nr:DEAD/DEAH box helicase [Phycisphaerales bacterium]